MIRQNEKKSKIETSGSTWFESVIVRQTSHTSRKEIEMLISSWFAGSYRALRSWSRTRLSISASVNFSNEGQYCSTSCLERIGASNVGKDVSLNEHFEVIARRVQKGRIPEWQSLVMPTQLSTNTVGDRCDEFSTQTWNENCLISSMHRRADYLIQRPRCGRTLQDYFQYWRDPIRIDQLD